MTTPLDAILRAQVATHGPMPLEDFMEACLSHPEHGYYMQAQPFGAQGDFITAPDISQLFGELLGAWLAQAWVQLGAPPRVCLAELGPGQGTLMSDALRATRHVEGFHAAISVHLVETSPRLRAHQRQALHPFKLPTFWHDSMDTLPALPLLLVANEFFDALPIRQRVRTPDGAEQWRSVGLDAQHAWCFLPPDATVIREECPAAVQVMTQISRRLIAHGGAALLVDYGYTQPSSGDTLQAMRAHAYASPLAQLGEADLTAHVDFHRLAAIATQHGLQALGAIPQGIFLDRLGGEFRLHHLLRHASEAQADALISGWRRLVSPNAMGTLFKVLACVPHGWESVAGFHHTPTAPEA